MGAAKLKLAEDGTIPARPKILGADTIGLTDAAGNEAK
jgi:hypothetical protein